MGFWYVYIMTNKQQGVLYIGVTDNIEERVKEHRKIDLVEDMNPARLDLSLNWNLNLNKIRE
ncbi:GIY-YIG nuclease family protein [Snuella lapsa]